MNMILLPLANAASVAANATEKVGNWFDFSVPSRWPAQGDLLGWCQNMGPGLAALLILLGVVYLLFGVNIFKILVALNAAAVGMILGAAVGDRTGAKIPMALVFGILAGAAAWPMMKHAVAIMGATMGALVGVTLWRVLGFDGTYAWSGAMIGLVAGGLLCFIVFRGCVMMYTSLQGSVMLIFGLLGLLLKYQDLAPRIGGYLGSRPFLLPMCVFVPTVIGMMYQQSFAGPPKPSGAGGGGKK